MMHDALTALPAATLKTMRSEALTALGKLATGQQVVTVSGLGTAMTYKPSTSGELRDWIAELNGAIRYLEEGRPPTGPVIPSF